MRKKAKGFIVADEPVVINGMDYSGVNTNPWPIGTSFNSLVATKVCEMSYLDLAFPLLVDFDSALHYCHLCKQVGLEPRMLFCEAIVDCPTSSIPQFENSCECTFLGFDYAYPSGDYYSAVANDILYRDIPCLNYWKKRLNEFGLLATENELWQFALERDLSTKESEKRGQESFFEKGNFVGFGVFLVNF